MATEYQHRADFVTKGKNNMSRKCEKCGKEDNVEGWDYCRGCFMPAKDHKAEMNTDMASTVMEFEFLKQQNEKEENPAAADQDPGKQDEPPKPIEPEKPKTPLWKPLRRTPMAVVTILDDGSQLRGETHRLRATDRPFVIGRSKGDVEIPNDAGISSQHLEVRASLVDNTYRWFASDINSKNGSFVRVSKTRLRDCQELLIGSRRYRFHASEASQQVVPTRNKVGAGDTAEFSYLEPPKEADMHPYLALQEDSGNEGATYKLEKNELVFGRDASADLSNPDDIYLEPHHCTFYQTDGIWHVRDTRSVNGTWTRFETQEVISVMIVRIGEQNIMIKVP